MGTTCSKERFDKVIISLENEKVPDKMKEWARDGWRLIKKEGCLLRRGRGAEISSTRSTLTFIKLLTKYTLKYNGELAEDVCRCGVQVKKKYWKFCPVCGTQFRWERPVKP